MFVWATCLQTMHGIEIEKIQKYQVAFRTLIGEYEQAHLLPVYTAGFISLEKQFLTIGTNDGHNS